MFNVKKNSDNPEELHNPTIDELEMFNFAAGIPRKKISKQ